MKAVPRKFIYEETSFRGNQYLIELQPYGSLGLMLAYGALPIGLKYLDYSLPSKSTWEVFRKKIEDFDYNELNDELRCYGICIELCVTYRHKIKFSAIPGGTCKLDELKNIINPVAVYDTFQKGVFSKSLSIRSICVESISSGTLLFFPKVFFACYFCKRQIIQNNFQN